LFQCQKTKKEGKEKSAKDVKLTLAPQDTHLLKGFILEIFSWETLFVSSDDKLTGVLRAESVIEFAPNRVYFLVAFPAKTC